MARNQYTQRKPLYFWNTGAPVCQKLGMTLENKVVQKFELEKNGFFYKKLSPQLIFLNAFFFERIQSIFDIEN